MIRRVTSFLLLLACLAVVPPVWGEERPLLDRMLERFDALDHYTTLLDSEGEDDRNRIIYTYKKPGFIRMDFIHPHKGARLIYNPHEEQVSLRPFATRLPAFTLSPDNPLITDPKGHTVDRSDIGALIRSVRRYAREGTVTRLAPESVQSHLCPRLLVEGSEVTYLLWVHPELLLPVKVVKLYADSSQETVFLRDLKVDGPLDDAVFEP
ncbi:LolA family protein [Desulfoluna butyratoxydans]|uniref:Lipoprotein localisation lola/lolb/lppx n=1 Tax=Desulfoluna butyratoxydans TaxID=231438 RepID=A0A4U8YMM8_9BACT|nr:DUF1571 domain-containing protein [Desulfoluna butyratoxydans]VFQ45010.1 lipoprotein localisation lola/lolb/lppx [Desulfoluna butyratoxydans]